MKKSYYFETTVDSNKIIVDNGNELIAHDTKGLLFWYDRYTLLKNQKAKVDKALINGRWYKLAESVKCIDLRNASKQLLLNQINS